MPPIHESLQSRTADERANIKGAEVAKVVTKKDYNRDSGLRIEIVEINHIDRGVEVFVRAWRNGAQIGFGTDGTVDIERFLIYNPPILIQAADGDIEQSWTDGEGNLHSRRLKESPEEALLQVIEHNLSVMKNIHDDKRIIPGKRGNTTSTFYPSFDGNGQRDSGNGNKRTWAQIRSDAMNGIDNTSVQQDVGVQQSDTANQTYIYLTRNIYIFDTSSIPDTDTISAATISMYGTARNSPSSFVSAKFGPVIVTANPASDATLVTGDFDIGDFGTTELNSSRIGYDSWSTSAYNDMTLNASGISAISKTGNTRLGWISGWDFDNTDPYNGSHVVNGHSYLRAYMADQTGTTNDPKLVVEHASAVTGVTGRLMMMGMGR